MTETLTKISVGDNVVVENIKIAGYLMIELKD